MQCRGKVSMSIDWVCMLVILHFLQLGVWVFLCDLLLAWKSLGVMSCRVDIRNGAENPPTDLFTGRDPSPFLCSSFFRKSSTCWLVLSATRTSTTAVGAFILFFPNEVQYVVFYKEELLALHLTPTWRTRVLLSLAPLPKSNPALPFRSISSHHHSSSGNNCSQASLAWQGTASGEGITVDSSKMLYNV